MKKILFIMMNLFAALISHSQVYIGFQSSYHLGILGRTMGDLLLVETISSNVTSENLFIDNRSSFGGGLKLGGIVGYKINQYIGLEMNVNFHKTNKISTTSTQGTNQTHVSLNGNIVSINPSLLAYIYDGNPKVYSKIGAIYNFGKFIFNYNAVSTSTQETFTVNIHQGHALGLSFAVGVDWRIKQHLLLRTELCYVNANYYPKKASLKKYELNGKDLTTTIDKKKFETTYSKTGNNDGEYYGSALGGGVLLRPQIPMNGIGLNIGLLYSFNKVLILADCLNTPR